MISIFGGPTQAPEIPEFDFTKSISYSAAAQRVSQWRGTPAAYNCAICLGDAECWAYRGRSEHEQTDVAPKASLKKGTLRRWSPNPMDYMPLCENCRRSRSKALASADGR